MAPSSQDLSAEQILIVDDEPDNLEVAQFTLELLYHARVRAVHSGQAALQALTPDITLILCDLMMPGMNGFELLPRLRERSAVPIIALTANAMAHDRQQALDAGFDGYIPKPFNADTLANDIVSCVAEVQRARTGQDHLTVKPEASRIAVAAATPYPATRSLSDRGERRDAQTNRALPRSLPTE